MSKKKKAPTPSPILARLPVLDAQINQVIEWVAAGNTEHDILTSIEEKLPGADPAKLLSAAIVKIVDDASADERAVVAWTFTAGKLVFRDAYKMGEFPAAIQALKFLQATTTKLAEMAAVAAADERAAQQGGGDVPQTQGK